MKTKKYQNTDIEEIHINKNTKYECVRKLKNK